MISFQKIWSLEQKNLKNLLNKKITASEYITESIRIETIITKRGNSFNSLLELENFFSKLGFSHEIKDHFLIHEGEHATKSKSYGIDSRFVFLIEDHGETFDIAVVTIPINLGLKNWDRKSLLEFLKNTIDVTNKSEQDQIRYDMISKEINTI